MELQVFVSFVLATALMIALPGPSVLLTIAHSVSFGWRHALVTVFGATLGIAVQLLIAVVGIGGLISFVAATFDILRWAGAGYLIYVGVSVWINAAEMVAINKEGDAKPSRLLLQGLVITVCNPKSLLFIVAFLPQFLDLERPVEVQFLIIVPTFLAITFAVTSAWAMVPGLINSRLQDRAKLAVVFRVAAALIVISGIGMVAAR